MRSILGDATEDMPWTGVRLLALGPVAATDAAGRFLELGPPRSKALLAALIVHAGRVLTVDQLSDLLWDGAPPATAATMVHGAVGRLRAVLDPRRSEQPPRLLVTRDGGYALTVSPEHTDIGRFRQLVDQARAHLDAAPAHASLLLAEALALWRGPALHGIDVTFARESADRWDDLRLDAVELRMAAELALGHHQEVAAELQELVHRHPFRERLTEHLVVALYRCGRQTDALQTLATLRRTLSAELGVEPGPRIQLLHQAVLRHDAGLDPPPRRRPATTPSPGLPAPYNSFVGRRRELGEIAALWARHRLVTLTGPGGSGKSRLAVEVARQLMVGGAEEVRMVDLARLTAPALVGETVAQAFGIRAARGQRAAEAVGAALSGRDVTIVLDNCEHLVEAAAALVESLLGAGPGLTVLVTSREVLRIPGERVYPVGPLATAATGDRWDDIAGCESVQLFAERASAARPDFAVTPANAALVLEVCRRLDGLPLALELAAARTASFPLAIIAQRLDDRFRLLDPDGGPTGDRHRSLAATLSWSYELLSATERLLFARLAVFAGTFSLASAEAVVADDELPRRDVGVLLGRLVAVSTVQMADDDGTARYRLLETTRAFGRGQLRAGTGAGLRERHAHHFLALARAAAPHLLGPSSPDWLNRLHTENDNFRAALEWAFGGDGDPHLAAELIACLWHPWDLRGARDEGLHWVRMGLPAVGPTQPELRLPLLSAGALFHLGRAEFDAVADLTGELLPLARSAGAPGWAADGLRMDATVAWARGRFDRAQHLYEDSVRTALAGNDRWRAALAEAHLARLHRDRDEPDAARATAVRAIADAEEVGEELARGLAVDVLASVEHRWGDRALALRLAGEALAHYRLVGYTEGEASALSLSGRIALDAHDWDSARLAFEQSLALCRRIGHPGGSAAALEGLAQVAARAAAPADRPGPGPGRRQDRG